MHRNLSLQCSNAWKDKGVGESGGDGADGVGEGGGSHPESSRALRPSPAPVPESRSGAQMTPKSTLEHVAQRQRCTKTTYDVPTFARF